MFLSRKLFCTREFFSISDIIQGDASSRESLSENVECPDENMLENLKDIRWVFINNDDLELIVVSFNSVLWPFNVTLSDNINLKNMPAKTKFLLRYKSNVMECLLVTVTTVGVLTKSLKYLDEKIHRRSVKNQGSVKGPKTEWLDSKQSQDNTAEDAAKDIRTSTPSDLNAATKVDANFYSQASGSDKSMNFVDETTMPADQITKDTTAEDRCELIANWLQEQVKAIQQPDP